MPIIIFLRDPKITMSIRGELDKKTIQKLTKKFKMSVYGELVEDGRKMLITGDINSNIVYIQEISMEEYEKMKKKQDERDEREKGKSGKKIDVPNMIINHPFSKKGSRH